MSRSEYGITRRVDYGYAEAVDRTKAVLADNGFGVLSEIDVAENLREKLEVDFDDYIILGACSPAHAYEALQEERELGLLLPCNVIVYRHDGDTYVSVINPVAALQIADNDAITPIAAEIETKLRTVLEDL